MIAGKVKSPRSVKLATWFIGLFTIDDYMSPLLRGVVMRPLTDEMRVPREKLAFLLDSDLRLRVYPDALHGMGRLRGRSGGGSGRPCDL